MVSSVVKMNTLFVLPEPKRQEKRRRTNGQFATKEQKSLDDRLHRAKLVEIENGRLKRTIARQKMLIEILQEKLNNPASDE